MDKEKLAESELEQKLVVTEETLGGDAENPSEGSPPSSRELPTDERKPPENSGKREPALIRVKNLKSRKEEKPSLPISAKKARSRYIAIALITTLIGILIVPIAWATFTVLTNAFPLSPGVQSFLPVKERSQTKSGDWRSKMRTMVADISKMPKPAASKQLATGSGDPLVNQTVLTLLINKKFDELTTTLEKATNARVQHRAGSELMDDLFGALSDPGDVTELNWTKRLALIEEWIAARPHSATPHLVLADFYVNYAWYARGSGWANQVKEWQWKQFRDRLYLSADQLQQALAFGPPSPEWFSIAQVSILGAGDGTDANLFNSVTRLANSFYPDYVTAYTNKVYYLQPRWYGKDQQWVEYAKKEADALAGDEGDKLYARMVEHVAHLYRDVYKEAPSLDKKRVARGDLLLDKQFGSSKNKRNQ